MIPEISGYVLHRDKILYFCNCNLLVKLLRTKNVHDDNTVLSHFKSTPPHLSRHPLHFEKLFQTTT